jgi:hypothetical protein
MDGGLKEGQAIKINTEKATEMWENGALDTEIAAEMNCSKVAVCLRRKRNDMKSNRDLFGTRERENRGGGKPNELRKITANP